MSNDKLDFMYRKPKLGKESDLVNSFLQSSYKSFFISTKEDYLILEEPKIASGFPDILLLTWDKSIIDYWSKKRCELEKDAIKILHHLYNCGERKKINCLVNELGYSRRFLERALENLYDANLIKKPYGTYYKIKDINKIFFLKSIITIEAKIKNWKSAFYQAELNTLFSSESYVLFPEYLINNQILSENKFLNIGVLSNDNKKSEKLRSSSRSKIPSSYYSWLINENIGRAIYNGQL